MSNERLTEILVREKLRTLGYDMAKVEEQSSSVKKIDALLSKASKTGKGGIGRPEFIVRFQGRADTLMVIECKAAVANHGNPDLEVPHDDLTGKAIDGALHYARFLASSYNVIVAAASGTEADHRISMFIHSRGAAGPQALVDEDRAEITDLLTPERMLDAAFGHAKRGVTATQLHRAAVDLHVFLRNYASLSESEKPLVVAGSLIALTDPAFCEPDATAGDKSYNRYDLRPDTARDGNVLAKEWGDAIERVFERAEIPMSKSETVIGAFRSAVRSSPTLTQHNLKDKRGKTDNRSVLCAILDKLDSEVAPAIDLHQGFDLVGAFYGEFLRYTAGDKKGLGIVLTPPHITDIFCRLADLGPTDVVLDPCTGTGGFLVTAMSYMSSPSQRGGIALDDTAKDRIKEEGLIGIEQMPGMFALAASNMILRGDGKANMFQGSCFSEDIRQKVITGKRENTKKAMPRPNVGMMNPPFAQGKKDKDLHEMVFIDNMLDMIAPGGTAIAIVPTSCATGQNDLRAKVLSKHTLEAVMTAPRELFFGVGVQTVIMVFTAHRPHSANKKTWFARWTDDGFITLRGRKDLKNKWPAIRDKWVSDFLNRERDTPGYCVSRHVKASDEWLAEAYMETDYSHMTKEEFEGPLREHAVFSLTEGRMGVNGLDLIMQDIDRIALASAPMLDEDVEIPDTSEWVEFPFTELFLLEKGSRIVATRQDPGDTPYVGASEANNGITGYMDVEPNFEAGCITVPYNGSIGHAFLQPRAFYACDDVHVLTPLVDGVSDLAKLFICALVRKEGERFSYSRKWNMDRMTESKLKLPVDDLQNPDWALIERYMSTLRYSGFVKRAELHDTAGGLSDLEGVV